MRKGLMKRALSFTLALAMVVTGSAIGGTVDNNTASAKKKKTVKLSKKKLTVYTGKTSKLTVKNANKKVKWSTSNKKVLKIKKTTGKKKCTAVLLGVKKGSAVVTAKVGKKKLKCKVTVKKYVSNVKSVATDPLDRSCLVVTLKKAAGINTADIKISTKNYKEGTYNTNLSVKALTSTDQITYRVYTNGYIYTGDYVKFVAGDDVLETQDQTALCADTTVDANAKQIVVKQGDVVGTYLSDYFINSIGSLKYAVTAGKLPDGLELNSKKGLIKGIPTAPGNFAFTVTATDELKRTATVDLTMVVYSDAAIANTTYTYDVRLDDYVDARRVNAVTTNADGSQTPKVYQKVSIKPYGGSGTYTFALAANDVAGSSLSTDGVNGGAAAQASSTILKIPYGITEGTHTFTVTATDVKDAARTANITVNVNAANYYNVKGTAKDSNSADLLGNKVLFIPVGSTSRSEYVQRTTFKELSATAAPTATNSSQTVYSTDYAASYYSSSKYYESANYIATYKDSEYSQYWYNYSALVGSSIDPTAEFGVLQGTYGTELKPGDYIVKIYSPADGIYYQMDSNVTVGAADSSATNIVTPARFYAVTGNATYANGSPVKSKKIYFEATSEKYENESVFSVTTDATGTFKASLPSNTYSAYILDSKGKRQYFTTDITVAGADTSVTPFALAISMSNISGTLKDAKGASLTYTNVYFLSGETDSNPVSVETDAQGNFTVALSDGEYTVLTGSSSISSSYAKVFGTLKVAGADQNGLVLQYNFVTDVTARGFADLTASNNSGQFAITTNGSYAKIHTTDAGSYTFKIEGSVSKAKYSIYVKNEAGESEGYDSALLSGDSTSFTLDANKDYYVFVSAFDSNYNGIADTVTLTTSVEVLYPDAQDVPVEGQEYGTASGASVYKFTAKHNATKMTIKGYDSDVYGITYNIYDAGGSYVYSDTEYASGGIVETDYNFNTIVGATYYIEIRACNDDYDTIPIGNNSMSIKLEEGTVSNYDY
ncbi:MAG: Ig domain-containing protein [Lachnospiraceae bacterium]|nr:Ig domain-containing protein [Lachnospiraceae bacterium]